MPLTFEAYRAELADLRRLAAFAELSARGFERAYQALRDRMKVQPPRAFGKSRARRGHLTGQKLPVVRP